MDRATYCRAGKPGLSRVLLSGRGWDEPCYRAEKGQGGLLLDHAGGDGWDGGRPGVALRGGGDRASRGLAWDERAACYRAGVEGTGQAGDPEHNEATGLGTWSHTGQKACVAKAGVPTEARGRPHRMRHAGAASLASRSASRVTWRARATPDAT